MWQRLPDGTLVHLCIRGKARAKLPDCATCKATKAGQECDGCDQPLCVVCSVSPRNGMDFCPRCFARAFTHWKSLGPYPTDRGERRLAFRKWARANADQFLALCAPLTAAAKAVTT